MRNHRGIRQLHTSCLGHHAEPRSHVITPPVELSKLLHKLKGSTARYANQLLGRLVSHSGRKKVTITFGAELTEFKRIENYILQNPVRAGL